MKSMKLPVISIKNNGKIFIFLFFFIEVLYSYVFINHILEVYY